MRISPRSHRFRSPCHALHVLDAAHSCFLSALSDAHAQTLRRVRDCCMGSVHTGLLLVKALMRVVAMPICMLACMHRGTQAPSTETLSRFATERALQDVVRTGLRLASAAGKQGSAHRCRRRWGRPAAAGWRRRAGVGAGSSTCTRWAPAARTSAAASARACPAHTCAATLRRVQGKQIP